VIERKLTYSDMCANEQQATVVLGVMECPDTPQHQGGNVNANVDVNVNREFISQNHEAFLLRFVCLITRK